MDHLLLLAPDQWTMIPVLVKIYKLLINELVNQLERNMSTQASADDDDDEVNVHEVLPSVTFDQICAGLLEIDPCKWYMRAVIWIYHVPNYIHFGWLVVFYVQ